MSESILRFEDVSYRYAFAEHEAVKKISFDLKAGQLLLVTGHSGCGKSTLMRLANGLCPNYFDGEKTGRIFYRGEDTSTMPASQLMRASGTLFQDPEDQFFALSVKDELRFALRARGQDEADINARVGTFEKALGIEHLSENAVTDLSEGQKQRVALAEILSRDPKLLILDEPSANLDPEATTSLARQLLALKQKGMALLVVDHRLHWLSDAADEVLVMHNGACVAQGKPQLLQAPGFCERWGLRQVSVKDVRATLPSWEKDDVEMLCCKDLSFDYEQLTKSQEGKFFRRLSRFLTASEQPASKTGKGLLFDRVNFSLTNGITALIGDNGEGKTTLARLMTGLNVGTGQWFLKGKELTSDELLKRTGLVLQNADHQLQMDGVFKEVAACRAAAGLPENKAAVSALLAKMHLSDLAHRHPQSLSGGQKQRLVIACALAKEPSLLILDEPTSGLDGANMQRVCDVLKDFGAAGGAVVLITHDLELLERCADRALRIREIKQHKTKENNKGVLR